MQTRPRISDRPKETQLRAQIQPNENNPLLISLSPLLQFLSVSRKIELLALLAREGERGEGEQGMDSSSSSSSRHEIEGVNREKARQRVESLLSTLLQDPILADVPKHSLSVSDVDVLINLELGSAIRLTILKMDNTSFEVAVLNSATVKDLKAAIRKKVNETEQANMGHRHISWKHVWANYCLVCNGAKLIDEKSLLSAYGIRNNCKIEFLPDVTSRLREKHSRRRKHRFFHGLSKKYKTSNC